jgi:uncharacterized protein
MSLRLQLRLLDNGPVRLKGEVPASTLDLAPLDPLIEVPTPLRHDLTAERLDDAVLARGNLSLDLRCQCIRCLRVFKHPIRLEEWACHIPLSGEDAPPMKDDSVDLTPLVREDIFLALPQHPLCEPDCAGVKIPSRVQKKIDVPTADEDKSPWDVLDKLKLK